MTAGVQCDTCRKFSPAPNGTWLYVVRPTPEPSFLAALAGPRDDPGAFCSMRCLAEWAYVHAVAEGTATGKEPQP